MAVCSYKGNFRLAFTKSACSNLVAIQMSVNGQTCISSSLLYNIFEIFPERSIVHYGRSRILIE